MLIVYESKTGNVKRFINKLPMNSIKISDNLIVNEPFVLITYTTGFGLVPNSVLNFLKTNNKFLRAVSASGNKNWGDNYAISADKISKMYNVPVLSKFELSGTTTDVQILIQRVSELADEGNK